MILGLCVADYAPPLPNPPREGEGMPAFWRKAGVLVFLSGVFLKWCGRLNISHPLPLAGRVREGGNNPAFLRLRADFSAKDW